MFAKTEIRKYRQTENGTDLMIHIPGVHFAEMISRKTIREAEIRFDDGRTISNEQRRKAYATIRDIADHTGYMPEEQKEWLKYYHIAKTGCGYFSLSDCSVDTAGEFINTILEYAVENGISLSDAGMDRADDTGKYLYFCIKHKKCCVCGRDGEIHHVDAVGMGNDRTKIDDSRNRKMCLCRMHHTIAHQRGMRAFEKMYRVYGITAAT